MTKAQKVRNRRLESRQIALTTQAKKVFDWILDLIDADTQKGLFRPIEVCLFDKQHTILTTDLGYKKGFEYFLDNFLLQHDWLDFFLTLKEVIEKEDGYTASLDPTATLYDTNLLLIRHYYSY